MNDHVVSWSMVRDEFNSTRVDIIGWPQHMQSSRCVMPQQVHVGPSVSSRGRARTRTHDMTQPDKRTHYLNWYRAVCGMGLGHGNCGTQSCFFRSLVSTMCWDSPSIPCEVIYFEMVSEV